MKYKGSNLNSRDIATIELLDEIRDYFDEDGAALNALALGGVRAEDYATTSYVDDSIAGLVDSAPDTLDTLGELAAALKDNEDIVATLDAAITAKAEQSDLEYQAERIDDIESTINNLYIPTNLSEFNNDVGFITGDALEGLITEQYADGKYATIGSLDAFLPKDAEASSASRLSDKSEYTAFGRTFFSNGKPVNITSSPISPANGGLYAYDFNSNKVLLFYYANGGDFSELRIGSESASREENVRICGYPLIVHHGSVNDGTVVAKTVADGIVVPTGRKLYLGEDDGYYITIEYDAATHAIKIDGNVSVTGTIASGGKGEEGDSALADLEARVAALESLIS